jgi:hypothetical protein
MLDDSDIAYLDVEASKFKKRRLQSDDVILEKPGGGPKQPVGRVVPFDLAEVISRSAILLMLSECRDQRLEPIYQQELAAVDALKKSLLHQAFTGAPRRQRIEVNLADGKARTIQHMTTTGSRHPDGTPMSSRQFMEVPFGKLRVLQG